MRVCLKEANIYERFAEDMDCSNIVGTPVKFGDDNIVGVVTKAWVDDGSLYADLEISQETERLITSPIVLFCMGLLEDHP